ncbi:MAG: leucyl aminopeptidase [Candidatus Woesearchaeota archaeon]|nr:leucyl aminopeptidase [Candidatus Woesearchaeota archaeon]
MNVTFSSQDIFAGKYDGVVLFTYEERAHAESKFATKLGNNVLRAREKKEFEGKHKQCFLDRQEGTMYVLVGLGKQEGVDTVKMREAAGAAACCLKEKNAKHIAVELPAELDATAVGQAVTEGVVLANYQFTKYRTQELEKFKELEAVTVVSDRTGVAAKLGVEIGTFIAESCNMTRDLQNTPSSDMPPAVFADLAVKMAKKEKLKYKVLDRKQLEKQGYGGIMAVGRGSANEPRMVTLEYHAKKAKKTIAVVGKGITFDSGGISIKPSPKMGDMKFDMSGAANVVGIMRNVARLKLPMNVVGIMGLAENMPSSTAYKPGDVVTTKSGKTIEVDNTDAEGRVVLADCLHHATTFKPDFIVDMATLTGAVIVALGDAAAGMMGNDDGVLDMIRVAGEHTGERVWELPLWDCYKKDIESVIADVKNTGLPRLAGTITAGKFLEEFVAGVPWVHIDIAGVAWADPRDNYFAKKGNGTGFGVRLITELLRAQRL